MLPAGIVTLRDSPSAVMLMVMSALVTCGERQLTSKEIASKAVNRNRLGGPALSRRAEWRSRVEVEIEVMRCIVSNALTCTAFIAVRCKCCLRTDNEPVRQRD